jgi:6-phosphogluconolactonase
MARAFSRMAGTGQDASGFWLAPPRFPAKPRRAMPRTAPLVLFLAAALPASMPAESCWVYFGTQVRGPAQGIYRAKLDEETGRLSSAVKVADSADPEFLALSPDRKYLYSLSRENKGGEPREAIKSYATDTASGDLRLLGSRLADGSEGCHISVDPSARVVLTANYDDHYVEVFPIGSDHTVQERSDIVYHKGSGPNRARQEAAHPHSINVDPSGRFAVVCDLALDKVFVYRLDAASGKLLPNPSFASIAPGSGPRHFAFHPDGRHAFVINELAGTITAMNWDGDKGTLTPYQTIAILDPKYSGPTNTSAEVVVSKSGRFVYGSNRGDDSLVVLSFDGASGKLSFVQRMGEGVKVPRNYAIDPSGKWLICANLTAGTATEFRVDPDSGRLTLVGAINVPESLCVRFLPI